MTKTHLTGLILLGITAVLPAEELSLCNNGKTINPTYWALNSRIKMPVENYKSVKTDDGKFYLDAKGKLGDMPLYLANKKIPAEDGEIITFKVTAKGKGKLQLGIYGYHEKGMSFTAYDVNNDLSSEEKTFTFKRKITMPKRNNAKPTKYLRPVMIIRKDAEAQITKVEYEITGE